MNADWDDVQRETRRHLLSVKMMRPGSPNKHRPPRTWFGPSEGDANGRQSTLGNRGVPFCMHRKLHMTTSGVRTHLHWRAPVPPQMITCPDKQKEEYWWIHVTQWLIIQPSIAFLPPSEMRLDDYNGVCWATHKTSMWGSRIPND